MRRSWAVVLLIGIFVSVLVSTSPTHAGRLYWSRNSGDVGGLLDNTLATVRTDGSGLSRLYLNRDDLLGEIAVDPASRRLYWVEGGFLENSKIVVGDAHGCQWLQIDSQAASIALDVTGGKIYWTESSDATGPGRILRANLDLTSVELVLEGLSGRPSQIGIDSREGKIYWYEGLNGEIVRSNLDGSNVEVQFEVSPLRGMQIDSTAQKIYWADWSPGGFRRANFDGSDVEELAPQVKTPFVIDASTGTVYWQAEDAIGPDWAGTIKRADLNGSNEAIVVHGHEAASGLLAFDPTDEVISIGCGELVPALGLRGTGLLVLLLLVLSAWTLRRS